jgi:hypothetical protein
MITNDQVNQHLYRNKVKFIYFLCSAFILPCGETPEIGVSDAGSYMKPNSWLKFCFGFGGKPLI